MKFFRMAKSVISSSPFFLIKGVLYKPYANSPKRIFLKSSSKVLPSKIVVIF
jgi:hypothetical protein